MRRGFKQAEQRQEIEIVYPEGYEEGDILFCEYTIESSGGVLKKNAVFCAKSGNSSVERVIGRFAQKATISKITINPIKKLGEANK